MQLAQQYEREGRYEDAEVLYLEEQYYRGGLDWAHEGAAEVMQSLADLYDAWGKPEQAAEWRAKLPVGREGEGT